MKLLTTPILAMIALTACAEQPPATRYNTPNPVNTESSAPYPYTKLTERSDVIDFISYVSKTHNIPEAEITSAAPSVPSG